MFMLSTARQCGAALCLGAALLLGAPAGQDANAAAQYDEQQLRLLYDEAAAIGNHTYTFYLLASKDRDVILDAHRALQESGYRRSLRDLMKLGSNRHMAFVLPAVVREQLNQLTEGRSSAPFEIDDKGWALVELESVESDRMPGFEQLRARLPQLVAQGALPEPEALRTRQALLHRSLMNQVDSARSFDRLPPGIDADQPLSSGYLLLQKALLRDDAGLVKALLTRGTNPNLCPMRACPLQLALQSKLHATDYVKQLLAAGALPDQVASPEQDTALTLAALDGHAEAVQLLLDKGADLNGGGGPRLPLTVAIHRGYGSVTQLLLDKGADPLYRKPAPGGSRFGSTATAMSIALQQGKPEGALLRTAVMKKLAGLPQHQWQAWIEQDGEKHPLEDGTLHLKRKPFTLFARLPAEAQLRLASCTSTRIFDEIRSNDLAAAVYRLDKPGLEPRDGSARWLLVSSDINPAAKARRPVATQTWVWSGLRQDFNRVDKTPQGNVYVREIDSLLLVDGPGEPRQVLLEGSQLPEVNMVLGSALNYDSDAGDFVNAHHVKLVFDR